MSVKVMGLVWYAQVEKANHKYVLLALADRADDQGYCYPGMDNLVLKTSLSRSSVLRSLERLEEIGLVKRRRRGNAQTNIYRINLPMLAGLQLEKVEEESDLSSFFENEETPGRKGSVTQTLQNPKVKVHSVTQTPLKCHTDTSVSVTQTPNTSVHTSVNTKTKTPPPKSSSAHNHSHHKAKAEEEEISRELKTFVQQLKWYGREPGKPNGPTATQLRKIALAVSALTAEGADLSVLRRELVQDTERGVRDIVAVYLARLAEFRVEDLLRPVAPNPKTGTESSSSRQVKASRSNCTGNLNQVLDMSSIPKTPGWCGKCEQYTRLTIVGEKCPDCSLTAAIKRAQEAVA